MIIPACQVIAITSNGILAGGVLMVSRAFIPILTHLPPEHALSSFSLLVSRIKPISSSLTLFSTLAYLFLAFSASEHLRPLYSAAAVLSLSGLPFTLIVMRGVYAGVSKPHGSDNMGKEREMVRALERWGALNYVRAMLPLSAGLVGLWTALEQV